MNRNWITDGENWKRKSKISRRDFIASLRFGAETGILNALKQLISLRLTLRMVLSIRPNWRSLLAWVVDQKSGELIPCGRYQKIYREKISRNIQTSKSSQNRQSENIFKLRIPQRISRVMIAIKFCVCLRNLIWMGIDEKLNFDWYGSLLRFGGNLMETVSWARDELEFQFKNKKYSIKI